MKSPSIQLNVNLRVALCLVGFPGLILMLMLMCSPAVVHAQDTGIPDSLKATPTLNDTIPQGNRPPGQGGSGTPQQEGQVDFQASDSLVFTFEEDRIATLFGSAKVTHQSGELTAGKVTLNLDKNLVSADTKTPQDTLSQPVLTREGDRVRSNSIDFNYETERGRFAVARVSIQQGNVIGTKVKNTSRDVVYLEDAIYSTCELDHPHYYIKAERMKVVDQEKIFFTNARLYILDIPYPMIFPFGYLPGKMDRKQSGLLEPTYVFQDTRTRGLGLQNFGWFQYFSDYIVGQASVDIFTSGTYFLDASTRYSKRDNYNGSIEIGYSKERGLEPTDPSFSINTQRRIGLSHNQDFSPYANISANINLRTADYYKRNSYNIDERAETSTNSSINYRYRHPNNLYNFSISARQNQNFQTGNTSLSGPSIDFSLQQFSPFASDVSTSEDSKWYENISIRYQNRFESDYQFDPIDQTTDINWFEALLDPSKYREATGEFDHINYGFQQDVSLSLGRLLPSRFINLSASGNYTEYWFPTTIRKSFDPVTNDVVERQVRGFTTARDFSTGLNMSTTFYGIINRKISNLEGFRHTVRPSLSFSYRPDFSEDFWGFYREVQSDTTGRTEIYSIFENEVFQGPSRGEQQSLGFTLDNVFEAKQVKRDSTGEQKEEILRLVDQLSFNTSYNFAADSLKLSDLNASLTSSIIKGINIRASASFNFYERDDSTGQRVDDFLISNSRRLAELTDFSVSASYNYSAGSYSSGGYSGGGYSGGSYGSGDYSSGDTGGSRGGGTNEEYYYPAEYDPYDQSVFNEMDRDFNRRPVQNINSPFSVSFNFRYSWRLNTFGDDSKSATLNADNIRFQLTPKWSFSTRLGYDFIQKELTPTQFSLNRNLHRWDLSFQMNPFGDFQYYAFSLRVNSGPLQSIFQKLPLLNNLQRTSSPTGRRPTGF